MTTYRVKLCCGNCCAKREYDIERSVTVLDSDLICANCGCSPIESDFKIYEKLKTFGKPTQMKEENE